MVRVRFVRRFGQRHVQHDRWRAQVVMTGSACRSGCGAAGQPLCLILSPPAIRLRASSACSGRIILPGCCIGRQFPATAHARSRHSDGAPTRDQRSRWGRSAYGSRVLNSANWRSLSLRQDRHGQTTRLPSHDRTVPELADARLEHAAAADDAQADHAGIRRQRVASRVRGDRCASFPGCAGRPAHAGRLRWRAGRVDHFAG